MSKSNVLAELPDQLASPSALNKLIATLRYVDLVRYNNRLEEKRFSQRNLKKDCHVRKFSSFCAIFVIEKENYPVFALVTSLF